MDLTILPSVEVEPFSITLAIATFQTLKELPDHQQYSKRVLKMCIKMQSQNVRFLEMRDLLLYTTCLFQRAGTRIDSMNFEVHDKDKVSKL